MNENESGRRQSIGGRSALLGGVMIAVLAFSAGVLGARSHRSVEPPSAAAVAQIRTTEMAVGASGESSQESLDRQVPGHSELNLQLD